MEFRTITRGAAILALGLAAAGCTSTSGGGGAGGGGGGAGPASKADFQKEFDRVTGVAPTSDMPKTLKAKYTGAAQMDLKEASTQSTVGGVLADLDLNVDWTEGQSGNPWSGSAKNFRGTFKGQDFTADGELTVANAEAKGLPSVVGRNESTINAPVVGPITTATGSAKIELAGDLESGNDTGTILMSLGGNMFGKEGAGIAGTAQGLWFDKSSGFGDVAAGGTFYLDKN
ncbi:hypothetical protein ATO6_08065 [Oceanicola sp. 22II-s10i]|uniref:hypothetical protein n=1 Tax=Oceanicola sp. 22II-s10i TaxID=1317116 RepID=UPI000B520890|nr:hypothetical protein [Oceanicola sp. 22II-s10i]OWU85014.1 hypothetical protein ATO6_08065 [Oceanicola sp. 22II-s10i]